MKISSLLSCVLGICLVPDISARVWTDITMFHGLEPVDASLFDDARIDEVDPFFFTARPSMPPALLPGMLPSTPESSNQPTLSPTVSLRASGPPPTMKPSFSPSTSPSMTPTSSPTLDEFAPNPVPTNPPNTYFNYDPSSVYGPGNPQVVYHNASMNKVQYFSNGWESAKSDAYWNEFGDNGFGPWKGILSRHGLSQNRCGNIGMQSPIDVVSTGASCFEHHQIRSRSGDMNIANASATTKLIQSNKLRLLYSRRPCSDSLLPECAEPDPPNSDFPHNWGGYADVLHVDFKTPSEHTINDKRFDGEMQIYHLHPSRRRLPAVSVMINSTDTYNWQLQAILDQFQAVYDEHKALCATKTRRERKLLSWIHNLLGMNVTSKYDDYETWDDFSTLLDDPNYNRSLRELQTRYWHPHHPELVPSIYFFGYEGSLTEPPCSEMVSWFVTDTPMVANRRQVEQLKRLIFTHVSPDCEKTSVHHAGEGVARPIQDSFRRPVWQCTILDFPADVDREVVPTSSPTPAPPTSAPPTSLSPTNAPITMPTPVVVSQMDPIITTYVPTNEPTNVPTNGATNVPTNGPTYVPTNGPTTTVPSSSSPTFLAS